MSRCACCEMVRMARTGGLGPVTAVAAAYAIGKAGNTLDDLCAVCKHAIASAERRVAEGEHREPGVPS